MNQSQYNQLFSFLFNIANDVLVQSFNKGDYKKIILPFIVLRRLDLLLEESKQQVINFCQTEEFAMMPEARNSSCVSLQNILFTMYLLLL